MSRCPNPPARTTRLRTGLVGWALTVICLLVFAKSKLGLWVLIESVVSVPVTVGMTFLAGRGPIAAAWVLYTH